MQYQNLAKALLAAAKKLLPKHSTALAGALTILRGLCAAAVIALLFASPPLAALPGLIGGCITQQQLTL